ncbi:MAG: tyrosine--tRNA ligase [Candidatus Cloacimonetes bacterium]|nr:tyrosine--tRNA ligase [Candidatus Cloacimonadota bacterium]
MRNVFDVLEERGFVRQCTDEQALRTLLEKEKVTSYIGYDPTAKSLTVGHLLPIMAQTHMQRAGHRVIVIMGGGTALIGDPSGKTEMRRMISASQIEQNAQRLKGQFAQILAFRSWWQPSTWETGALMINNARWLTKLNHIRFLRDIGVHFSVNRMLSSAAYEGRMEKGLSFIEFGYMPLQAYDFLVLFRKYGCKLQMGGDDQWGNILAGVDLIRRVEGETVHALTFPLIETATGQKMGKTATGAVWLDPELTSPYEFFQYWVNVDDRDVKRFLALFTFLPMGEVQRLGSLSGAKIRQAKEVLAYEVTKIVHGEREAEKAKKATRAIFGGEGEIAGIPTLELTREEIDRGIPLVNLFEEVGLTSSRGAARRLVEQEGAYLNDKRVKSIEQILSLDDFTNGEAFLRRGKKKVHRLKLAH